MARQVKSWASEKRAPQHIRDEWTTGEQWQAEKSVDFPGVKVETFRTYLYRKAQEIGMEVRTEIVDDSTIQFQFLPLQDRSADKR